MWRGALTRCSSRFRLRDAGISDPNRWWRVARVHFLVGVGCDFEVDRVRPGYGHWRVALVGLWRCVGFVQSVLVSG